MGRSIVTAASINKAASRSGPRDERDAVEVDGYGDALLKLIPAEVVGVYLAMQSILTNANDIPNTDLAFTAVFLFGIFATIFYLRVTLQVTNYFQVLLSVGAFCVWAYTLVPDGQYAWHNGTYAGLLLLAYTFIAPKISIAMIDKAK